MSAEFGQQFGRHVATLGIKGHRICNSRVRINQVQFGLKCVVVYALSKVSKTTLKIDDFQ